MKNLLKIFTDLTQEQRDKIGNAFYFILACFINMFAWLIMLGVEYVEYLVNRKNEYYVFEYKDVKRYTMYIFAGCCCNFILGFIWWLIVG